jgi:hypothetical protein
MALTALRYPKDISSEYYIKFEFYTYEPAYSGASSTLASGSAATRSTTLGYNTSIEAAKKKSEVPPIYLPMPAEVGSQYVGQWGGQNLNNLTAGLLKAAADSVGRSGAATPTAIANAFKNVDPGNAQALAAMGIEQLFNTAKTALTSPLIGANLTTDQLLALGTNSILNPNTELLYSGTDLRTHGYKFKLVPNSDSEARDIKRIVTIFKQAALPKRQSSVFGLSARNFIGIPDLCQVEFIKRGGGDNKNLPKYKLSAISNVDVNYITDGQYIEYDDGFPLGIELTLAFKELKLLFSEEIGEEDSNYR